MDHDYEITLRSGTIIRVKAHNARRARRLAAIQLRRARLPVGSVLRELPGKEGLDLDNGEDPQGGGSAASCDLGPGNG
jgi:hypothetical protein